MKRYWDSCSLSLSARFNPLSQSRPLPSTACSPPAATDCQNVPETLCSRQNQRFFKDSEAWKAMNCKPYSSVSQLFNIMIKYEETRCCQQNHCFFNVFWRAEVGLKRETLIKFSYFITPALLPKQAWNTILSTKSIFVGTVWHAEISLKRETLIKFSHLITLAPCTNKPETRCCRQNQRFFKDSEAWKAMICKPYSSVSQSVSCSILW